MNTALQRLQTRLEKLELEHLRRVVAEQGARIEDLERECNYWRDCSISADARASVFSEMLNDANFTTHRAIGITRDGEMLVVAQ